MDILFNFSNIKSFDDFIRINERFYYCYNNFKSESFFITSLFFLAEKNIEKLKLEFFTAVGCLQLAAKWKEIQETKHIFPYLQFDSVIDTYSTALERKLNKIIKHVDDVFWDTYFPINYFGDRSNVIQLRIGKTTAIKVKLPIPKPGFEVNLYKPTVINDINFHFVIHNIGPNIEFLKNKYNNLTLTK